MNDPNTLDAPNAQIDSARDSLGELEKELNL